MHVRYRWSLVVLVALMLGVPLLSPHAASAFAAPAFMAQWQAGEGIAPNFWGPLANAHDGQQEPYKETDGGMRLVQYFDKGRMELTKGKVTNGLLATEMTTGQVQMGNARFVSKAPPAIPIAGDPDNPGPTYASLATKASALFEAAPNHTGAFAQAVVSAGGDLSVSDDSPTGATTFALFDDVTKHNVPAPFATYRMRVGLATIGYAKSEPFLTTVNVGGTPKPVMVQVFERRVLTYTDSNPNAFKVEMGNIGQHYSRWRYESGSLTAPSTPMTTMPATGHVGAASAYPNPTLTPGDTFPGVTAQQVCVSGYSTSVRAVASDEKRAVYQRYGIANDPGQHEVDHFIALELGGSNALTNLWPEAYEPRPGAHEKDRVENSLHDQVCAGKMTLGEAQAAIRSDWVAVTQRLG